MNTSKRHVVTITALALSLVFGSTLVAPAQTRGNNPSTGGGTSGGDGSGPSEGDPGRIVRYGTPGNCPPTIACAPPRRDTEPPKKRVKAKVCDRWELVETASGRHVKKCVER